jgi:hypothetical protein
MIHYLAALVLPAQLAVAVPADSVDRLRNRARAAEATFERLARDFAPYTWGGGSGRDCDEIVGRFCLTFGTSVTRPSAEERGRVTDARREAVEALRRYFSVAPGSRDAAGPLVRLLVLDGRAGEAVSAARTFAALSSDTLWADLLQGLAQHAAGDGAAAERSFVRALGRMDASVRGRWVDPEWLLDHREQRMLRRLSPGQRAEYERRFWIASNPLWLTPANERWVEHMARHAAARLLAEVPRVAGAFRWGPDLDQLTVRYGTPTTRAQVRGNMPWDPSTFIEYYDTAQRAYSPENLLSLGFPTPPLPGEASPLFAAKARSGYALRLVTRVVDLPHQVTRFLAGDDVVVRVDGALPAPPDSGARAAVRLGLFAYDTAFTRRAETRTARPWTGDTLRFSLSVAAAAGDLVYSVEALDTVGDVAARGRYLLPALVPADGPVVSDLLVADRFEPGALPEARDDPGLRGRASLEFAAGDTLGLFAEIYRVAGTGPAALGVELALQPADGPGLLTRLGRWLGRAVGLAGAETEPRVTWRAAAEGSVHSLALNLPLDASRTGRQVLVLRVTDLHTGGVAETRRVIMIRPR